MESNDRFLKNSIKNHTCYYFDDIIMFEDFDRDILKDEKSNNILFYNISCYFDECYTYVY